MEKKYCEYYHVKVQKEKTWFVIGSFRNEDHLAFERTMDGQSEILEFFVPQGQEQLFLDMMSYMQKHGYVHWVKKEFNRMEQESIS